MGKKQSLAREATVLSISKITVQIFMLISVMILTRIWTLNEYGTYSQLQIVVNLLISIFMLGLPNSINYFVVNSETKEARHRFLSSYYTLSTLLGIVIGVVTVLFLPLVEDYFGNESIGNYMVFVAIIPLTKIIMNSIENALIVYKRTALIAVFSVSHGICIVLVALVSILLKLRFSEYMVVYLIIECFFTLIIYIIVNCLDGRLKVILDLKLIRKVLAFSLPLGLASTAGMLQAETDKLVIGFFYNTERMAVYANAAKELPIKIIAVALATAIMPYLTRLFKEGKPEKAIELWKNTTTLSLIVHVFLSMGLVVFSEEAMTFLYSDKYIQGAGVFAIYSLTYIVRATSFGSLLASMGKTKYVFFTELIMLAANIVLNILFYYIFSFIGPAIATVVVSTTGMLIILRYASIHTHIGFGKIYPWKDLVVILAVNICLGFIFYIAKILINLEQYLSAPGEAFVFAGCWAGIVLIIFRRKIVEKWTVMKAIS